MVFWRDFFRSTRGKTVWSFILICKKKIQFLSWEILHVWLLFPFCISLCPSLHISPNPDMFYQMNTKVLCSSCTAKKAVHVLMIVCHESDTWIKQNRILFILHRSKKQNNYEKYSFPSISAYFRSNQKDLSLLMSWFIVITNSWQTGLDSLGKECV